MMKREHAYLILAVAGAIAPWLGFARFFGENGMSGDFIGALFANGASAGFTIDVLISSLVFWVFLFDRTVRERLDHPWTLIMINLAIGLSCALPLALWRIERRKRLHSQGATLTTGSKSVPATSSVALLLAAVLTILIAAPVRGQTENPAPGAVVDRFFDAYRSRDVDGMLALYAPDAVFLDVAQRHRFEGREKLAVFLRRLMDLHISTDVGIRRRLASGGLVVVEYAYTGMLSGEALHAQTGKQSCRDTEYSVPVTSWFEVKNGQIVRQTDFIDLATLAEVRQRASGETPDER